MTEPNRMVNGSHAEITWNGMSDSDLLDKLYQRIQEGRIKLEPYFIGDGFMLAHVMTTLIPKHGFDLVIGDKSLEPLDKTPERLDTDCTNERHGSEDPQVYPHPIAEARP